MLNVSVALVHVRCKFETSQATRSTHRVTYSICKFSIAVVSLLLYFLWMYPSVNLYSLNLRQYHTRKFMKDSSPPGTNRSYLVLSGLEAEQVESLPLM